jgi:hypothetical protein
MEIKKIDRSELEGFAEFVKGPNTCACNKILSRPAAQAIILDALGNNAHRLSKICVATGDDYYANNAEENRKLWKELRIAFGLDN